MTLNKWWSHHFKEIAMWCKRFYEERNIEDYDRGLDIYEKFIDTYGLDQIPFSEFIEIGKSLRARQAPSKHSIGNYYES